MNAKLIFMLLVLIASSKAMALQLPDLSGAQLIEQGVCKVDDEVVMCIEVEKEGSRYVVFHDGEMIYFIFKVKAGAAKPYQPSEMEQIYPAKGVSI